MSRTREALVDRLVFNTTVLPTGGQIQMQKQAHTLGKQSMENLENRVLLSTINVNSFGAAPNDGGDDRAAIQAAVDAARPGDTVLFNDGTYKINGQIKLKNGI